MPNVFRSILAGKVKTAIIAENEFAVCFRDIEPAASTHLLVIPRRHIDDWTALERSDIALLKEMQLLADEALLACGIDPATTKTKRGCMTPPFNTQM